MIIIDAIRLAIAGVPVELRDDPDMRTGKILWFHRAPFAVVEWNDGTTEVVNVRDLQDGRLAEHVG
jgi:hypothetical protein